MRSDFPAARHIILVPRPDVGFWEILDSDSLTQQISLPQKPKMRRWEGPPWICRPLSVEGCSSLWPPRLPDAPVGGLEGIEMPQRSLYSLYPLAETWGLLGTPR